jgi:hypothetical protein
VVHVTDREREREHEEDAKQMGLCFGSDYVVYVVTSCFSIPASKKGERTQRKREAMGLCFGWVEQG